MFNFFNTDTTPTTEYSTIGKCSKDPSVLALVETFIYEARQLAYYLLKIKDLGYENFSIIDKVITTLASINFAFNYVEADIQNLLEELHSKKSEVVDFYINLCKRNNLDCQLLQPTNLSDEDITYLKAIIAGEKQSIKKNTKITSAKKNLYEIIIMMAKSASILVMKLQDYEIDCLKEKYLILELINNLNFINIKEEKLTKKIMNFTQVHYELNKLLNTTYEKAYGKVKTTTVKLDKIQGKCILVSGDNYNDLDLILKATEGTEINVYTHDKMILAFSYPHFQKYSHLKGHYQNVENSFQVDFAKFPGPVILSRNYNNKIDDVYRGRLYTTDFMNGKGISKIANTDFSEIIKCAQEMDGFKQSQGKLSVKVGYNFNTIQEHIKKIIENFRNGQFKSLYFVGLVNHTYGQNKFFENFYEKLPDDVFVISLAYNKKSDNIYHINSYFDFWLIYRILELIQAHTIMKKIKIGAIITQCVNESVTNLLTLKRLNINDLYISCCNGHNKISPPIQESLIHNFQIKSLPDDVIIENIFKI